MIGRNVPIQAELVEQGFLRNSARAHHCSASFQHQDAESDAHRDYKTYFSTASVGSCQASKAANTGGAWGAHR